MVGVSPVRVGVLVCCLRCAEGLPLCWEACGVEIVWCALMADLCPLGCFEPFPSWWYMATPPLLLVLWCWPHVAAPHWCPSLSASVCSLSAAPWGHALVCLTSLACCGPYPLPILLLPFCHCCVLDKVGEHL